VDLICLIELKWMLCCQSNLFVAILDRKCSSYSILEYNHISIRFRYNAYAMIGNDFDEVNCYGLLCHMTFKQQEYNLYRFQCDSVSSETLLFILSLYKHAQIMEWILLLNDYAEPQPVNSH
jgi:hypothetical protein